MVSEKLVFKDIDSLDLLLSIKSIFNSSFSILNKFESEEYRKILDLLKIEPAPEASQKEIIGLDLNPQNDENIVEARWLAHIYASLLNPIANNFHIIDLTKRALGLMTASVEHRYPEPEVILEEAVINKKNLKILFKESKTLICENIFLDQIATLNTSVEVILIGEKISTAHIRNATPSLVVHDFRESLTISQIARLMFLSDICILEPSTASVLASGYGTLTICLAKQNELNNLLLPYGQGHLIIESIQTEKSSLSFAVKIIETILTNAPNTLSLEEWKTFGETIIESEINNLRFFVTTLVESEISSGKKIEQNLFPLLFQGTKIQDLTKMSHEISLSNCIDQELTYPFWAAPIQKSAVEHIISNIDHIEQFSQLCLFAKNYCLQSSIGSNAISLEKIHSSAKKLEECDELFRLLAITDPLIQYYFLYLTNLQKLIPSSGLTTLSMRMANTYQHMSDVIVKHLEIIAEILTLIKDQEKEFLNLVKE